ncbi:hypothetical protein A3D81_00210 [Candidatus Curtissbacteria bacterium RIFCSPHIGHO2_02_FULL_40_17]|uniref:Fido domain-containing protein n=4 Tax=Candidatus Curtissiibacteriota TaxID=1752717 RepID=A0A1F5GGH7_9BACT|nr:MAG: hypothetical protein A2693_02005 [Candidatus Curtissbacteria bacterium RIFCSPHIGHO2_01_FULL_40_12]OGD90917.1 MAG: hypothetical protein A3D81_00210 [Candidatus Curtissbacteria bacterium RIFCSPHIGHO2_02_FULL_40_17]OGE04891.1 MAG: hypothetical protein A3F45_01390 [Candidatus Curtissbacteria bacterium RIFCSPHIGHO2_12_FULL_41_17]OGE06832.1 MAG: hypothetical protein A3I53_01390 [Candidatus Curtissbacteria bacterium RIFCSPLOWO2_02_FULL_40_13b]
MANLKHQAVHCHRRIIEEIGGAHGLREEAALESAVATPFATFSGDELHTTVFDKAAALMRSLSLNHPFVDGNKRMSLVMTASFLLEHGLGLIDSLTDDEIVEFCLSLAKGEKKLPDIAAWLKENTDRSSARSFRKVMEQFQAT